MTALTTILNGGVAIGEAIVLNPTNNGDNNLAHTTTTITQNGGGYGPGCVGSLTDQFDHHTKLLALLGPGEIVRPYTTMSPTVDMRKFAQAVQMWTWAQYACGRAVADAVAAGDIPEGVAEGLLISMQVFIHPEADSNTAIFQTQYGAARDSIHNAMNNTQTVGKMLENRTKTVHLLCQHEAVGDEDPVTYTPEEIQKLIDAVRTPAPVA